jgi:hypothetical protein
LAKERCRKIGMLEDRKFILLLDNYNTRSNEFELWLGNISVLYLPSMIVLNVHAPSEEKSDGSEDSSYGN